MHGYHVFTILIIIITVLTIVNNRLLKWPATIAVTVFSFVTSILVILLEKSLPELNQVITSNLQQIEFNDIVMHVVLGFLLFGAAFKTNAKNFFKHIYPIATMALLSTLISTFAVAGLLYYTFTLLHHTLPFIECLLFGALISPTDPIAVLAILRNIGISKKIEIQITGESILNDGIAIVLFTSILNIAMQPGEDYNFSNAGLLFLKEAGGGVLFGAAIGGIAYYFLRMIDNDRIEILITLSVVMGGYTLGEILHISSPISMVVAGLICSVPEQQERTHISSDFVFSFWSLVEELINFMLFLLIGIGVFVIPFNGGVILSGFLSIVILLIARLLAVLPVYLLLKKYFENKSLPLYVWGALRGVVSIALALSIPAELNRSELLSITYIIAVFSIVVQGLTIKHLALKLGMTSK